MKAADSVDAARVELFLADLRLPAIKQDLCVNLCDDV